MTKLVISILSLLFYAGTCNATVIPAGTEIKMRVAEPVKSQIRRVGHPFKLTLEGDLLVDGQLIIKDGGKGIAKITKLKTATRNSEAEIEVTLSQLTIARKRVKVTSYPVAGKGELPYTTELGSKNLDRDEIISSLGTPIANTIPVVSNGNFVEINKDTIIYFVTTQEVRY